MSCLDWMLGVVLLSLQLFAEMQHCIRWLDFLPRFSIRLHAAMSAVAHSDAACCWLGCSFCVWWRNFGSGVILVCLQLLARMQWLIQRYQDHTRLPLARAVATDLLQLCSHCTEESPQFQTVMHMWQDVPIAFLFLSDKARVRCRTNVYAIAGS